MGIERVCKALCCSPACANVIMSTYFWNDLVTDLLVSEMQMKSMPFALANVLNTWELFDYLSQLASSIWISTLHVGQDQSMKCDLHKHYLCNI